MRLLSSAFLVGITSLATVLPAAAQQNRTSPHETISTVIGDRRTGNRITLTYGRPYSKHPKTSEVRTIWGGLVPWGKADRLGADEATLLITQKPLVFGSTTIPAGAYTLYIVPAETGASKLVFSSSLGKWGIPVDETHDVARVDLQREKMDEDVGQLMLGIKRETDTSGALTITWEHTQFSAPFTVQP